MTTHPTLHARTITVSIDCPTTTVYEYVLDGRRLPEWSVFQSATPSDRGWLVEIAGEPRELRYVERNPYGVLDHFVTQPDGQILHVPMRAIPNGSGTEVLVTVLQLPEVSALHFEETAAQVQQDLHQLKEVLESATTDP